jgi:ribosomal protein L37AE/L43A
MRDVKMTCPKCGNNHNKKYFPDGMIKCLECKKKTFFIDWYPKEIQEEEREKFARKKQVAR